MNIPRWLTFLLGSLTDFHSPAVLNFFLSSDPNICFPVVFRPLVNSDHVVASVSIGFPSNSKGIAPFHCTAFDHFFADWEGLCDHLRDVLREDVFKHDTSAGAAEFCEWVQVGNEVYTPHRKYHAQCHFYGCTATLAQNTYFVCTNRIYLKWLIWSSDRLVIVAKRFLKPPNLFMLTKPKSILPWVTFQKLGSHNFLLIANSVLNEVKSAILLYLMVLMCFLLHLIKQNFLLKTFLRTQNSGISLPVFPSRTNLHNASVTPKLV